MNDRRSLRAAGLLFAAALLSPLPACAQPYQGGTATEPGPRGDGPWMQMHERFLEQAGRGGIDLLFLGDSITQGWNNNPTWQRHYGPRHAANFGIGGDRTQHVLWRLDHGELDAIKPKLIVLLIGTNNLGNNTADEIAEGVRAILDRIRAASPTSKVLLLGVFPRGADRDPKQEAAAPDPRVRPLNERVARLADGQRVRYLDIGDRFLDAQGRVPKSLMPDFLHLSQAGYRAWADAMEPTLWDMLEGH